VPPLRCEHRGMETTQIPERLQVLQAPEPERGDWLTRARESQWTALALLLTAPFMVVLDFFIVNVAIPSLSVDLHAGSTVIEWVVAGYGLTTAIGLVAAGRLGDRVGRRRVFWAGMLVFTLASAVCGLAPSGGTLVAARLVQGLGAALVTPQVLSILSVVYQGKERARAFGIYGMTLGLAAVLGQLIGGLLIQADVLGLGWRACFLINIPIGLVALVLLPRVVPESKVEGAGRLDLVGMALITLGLGAIVLPLIEGRSQGWPLWTWLSLAASPVILGVFGAYQRRLRVRGGEPLLDPALFRERAFTAGLLTTLAFFASMASFFLVLALYLQPGRGLDALQAGLVFTILAVAYLATSMRAPELAARYGRRLPALGGLVLAAGHATLAYTVSEIGVGHDVLLLTPGLLLAGAGMGLVLTPLTTAVLVSLPPEQAGAASGALSTMQNVGNALGVALIGVVFFDALDSGYAHAFVLSTLVLAGLGLALAALSRLLPAQDRG
jgi:EmrB/QacA subfamily drug resistance transporter